MADKKIPEDEWVRDIPAPDWVYYADDSDVKPEAWSAERLAAASKVKLKGAPVSEPA